MTNTKPKLKLIGEDGNAFSILGRAMRVMRAAGWEDAKIGSVVDEATAGDYDHLLATMDKYFDVT